MLVVGANRGGDGGDKGSWRLSGRAQIATADAKDKAPKQRPIEPGVRESGESNSEQ